MASQTHFYPRALAASCLLLGASVAQGQDTDQRLDQLENQVQSLRSQLASATDDRVTFNGFLSLAYGMADNDAGYGGYLEEGTFENESLFGLQGQFKLTDATNVTMQIVGRGNEDWDPSLEWAYISHRVTPEFTLRAGKMRLPLFMYSDSLEVGYAQPWSRPPEEVYGQVPVTSYTGVDGIYDLMLDNSTLTFQGFVGESEEDITTETGSVTELQIDDLVGGSVTWTDFIWTLRGNFAQSEISTGGDELGTDFYGLGFSYNNGTWQVISELTRLDIEGVTPDTDSGYITLARTFGSITPYATVSRVESTDDNLRDSLSREAAFTALTTPGSPFFQNPQILSASQVVNVERNAYSLGIRWDALSSVAVKFDVTHATDFGDTGGDLPGNLAPQVRYDDSSIYSIKIDSAF